jgi:hypothetical protein
VYLAGSFKCARDLDAESHSIGAPG